MYLGDDFHHNGAFRFRYETAPLAQDDVVVGPVLAEEAVNLSPGPR